ncbi:hypothetical protein E3N88_42394 [Mikania micrantha]|uniref:Uncharacterized protein n=1 Tax=Mikania micrantha TaxID=192012 RepID=A0A5N6LI09_9ASTR|nr:hypothetical protein E3N88_42394 [Mikania micrantha]
MKHLQNQETFSFSTSSKTGIFSGAEDGDVDGHNHNKGRFSGHHRNDYFEISLPPPSSPSTTKTDHSYSKEDELEFCFSFNSSSTLVDFPTNPIPASSNHPFHHDRPPTPTSVASQLVNVDKKHNHSNKINKPVHYKRMFQSRSSPRCHQGLVSPYIFLPSRSSTRLGGIRKLMVKLSSIKSMLRSSSLNASRRLQPAKVKIKVNKKSTSVDHKQTDCGHMIWKSSDNNDILANTHSQRRNHRERSSRIMNFNGFIKMLGLIMRNVKTTRIPKQTDSKSCPVSIKSSPMHDPNTGNDCDERRNSFYLRDHSIQAAIAHCKKSFGR